MAALIVQLTIAGIYQTNCSAFTSYQGHVLVVSCLKKIYITCIAYLMRPIKVLYSKTCL